MISFASILKIYAWRECMISYRPLWETLENKGHSIYWLLNHGVDSKTLYNLKHNKNTTLITIEKICNILGCKMDEVVEFVEVE